jgi:hypothetical protein
VISPFTTGDDFASFKSEALSIYIILNLVGFGRDFCFDSAICLSNFFHPIALTVILHEHNLLHANLTMLAAAANLTKLI